MIVGYYENGEPVTSEEVTEWLRLLSMAVPEYENGLENTALIIEALTAPPPAKAKLPTLRLVA